MLTRVPRHDNVSFQYFSIKHNLKLSLIVHVALHREMEKARLIRLFFINYLFFITTCCWFTYFTSVIGHW